MQYWYYVNLKLECVWWARYWAETCRWNAVMLLSCREPLWWSQCVLTHKISTSTSYTQLRTPAPKQPDYTVMTGVWASSQSEERRSERGGIETMQTEVRKWKRLTMTDERLSVWSGRAASDWVFNVKQKRKKQQIEPLFYIVAGCISVVSARFLFSLPVLTFCRRDYCTSGCSLRDQQTSIFCAWGEKGISQTLVCDESRNSSYIGCELTYL